MKYLQFTRFCSQLNRDVWYQINEIVHSLNKERDKEKVLYTSQSYSQTKVRKESKRNRSYSFVTDLSYLLPVLSEKCFSVCSKLLQIYMTI